MNVYSNVLDMVGKTPMLEVTNMDTGACRLFLKLELMNPGEPGARFEIRIPL